MEKRIFVVEGDFELRRALADLFEYEGWRSALFPAPEEALEALAREEPWFVVLDLPFRGMSGSQMLLALHQDPRWSRLPVAVFTGWMDFTAAVRLDVPVVKKPRFSALLDLIRLVAVGGHAEAVVSAAVQAPTRQLRRPPAFFGRSEHGCSLERGPLAIQSSLGNDR